MLIKTTTTTKEDDMTTFKAVKTPDGKIFRILSDAPDLFIMQSISDDYDYTDRGTLVAAIESVKADIEYDPHLAGEILGMDEEEVEALSEDEIATLLDKKASEEASESLHTFTHDELLEHISQGYGYKWALDYLEELQIAE